MSEETCPDCGRPYPVPIGSAEGNVISPCFSKFYDAPGEEEAASEKLDDCRRVTISNLRSQLSAATARASELETFRAEASDVLRHALSDFFEEEDGWIERASALCGDERLSRLKRAAKVEEVLQAALNQKTEQLLKADQNLTALVAQRDTELDAMSTRVARAERELEAHARSCGCRVS